MAQLEIRLLGNLQFLRDNVPINGFISNKVPALLAYLAITHRPHSRDKLACLLWGENSDADARNNLRQALSNLRRFADDCLTITRDSIEFTGDCYLDSSKFESNVRTASSLDPQPASIILADSIDLYRGDFLEGFFIRDASDFEDWMLAERLRLRELALQTLHTLTQYHTNSGHFSEAIAYASRLLSFDPWREEAHRQLMLLQARTGQPTAALAQYEACRKILDRELGVEPSFETTALYERIRAARQSAQHNIPAASTELIGRGKELDHLRQIMADPNCRLITLTGLGGIGKTRLAQEAARKCVDLFINGAWYIPLVAVEAQGIVPAMGNTLEFPFTTGDHRKQLLNYLRQKELLLVLDNFEHLLDSSSFLSDILKIAPEVKLLVTSRERLDLDGEWVVELSGLDVNTLSPARLFIQSAMRAQADIQFSEQDQAAIADICRLVGGLPLGIEIAAAWIRSMDCESIANEIRKSLDFLASTRRDIPERQRSLRAVFESSWERLTEVEQKAFTSLSVFRGGFTHQAAEQVTGLSITTLVEKSFVQLYDARFELHELMRKFAEEKLNAKKKLIQQARAAHAAYFAEWTRDLSKRDERESSPLMMLELENVRAAWTWAAEQTDVSVLSNLASLTKRYLNMQGRFREGIDIFQLALDKLDGPSDAKDLPLDERGRLTARLHMYTAVLIADAGEPELSLQTLRSCLEYFRRVKDDAQILACLNGLGNAMRLIGEENAAAVYYREEMELARSTGNQLEQAMALNNLALVINTLGDFEEAGRLHKQCLALRREMDDYPHIASSLINLGVVFFDQHKYDQARPLLVEAIEISRKLNQTRQLAAALGNLGGILNEEGRHQEALTLFQQGLEIHRNTGYRYGTAIALDNVGTANYYLGSEREALYYLRQSIREARDIKADFVALDALVWIGAIRAADGEKEKALEIFDFVRNHPKTDPESLQNVEKLSPGVPDELKSGRSRELSELIDEVLEN